MVRTFIFDGEHGKIKKCDSVNRCDGDKICWKGYCRCPYGQVISEDGTYCYKTLSKLIQKKYLVQLERDCCSGWGSIPGTAKAAVFL